MLPQSKTPLNFTLHFHKSPRIGKEVGIPQQPPHEDGPPWRWLTLMSTWQTLQLLWYQHFTWSRGTQGSLSQVWKDKASILLIPTGRHPEDKALISYAEKWGSLRSLYNAFIIYALLCQAAPILLFVWHYMSSRKTGGWSLNEWKKLLAEKSTNPSKKTQSSCQTRERQNFHKW